MGKQMKLPSFFKNKATKTSWRWLPCKHPKTISSDAAEFVTIPDSSWSTNPEVSVDSGGEPLEMVFQALRSERLFFKPDDTGSILTTVKAGRFPFMESVVLVMESENTYMDFRISMEEMVEAHGLKAYGMKDLEWLEELLAWYLKMNKKKHHGSIVGAFVDMFVDLCIY